MDKIHLEVRDEFLKEETTHKVLELARTDQRSMEHWIDNMLAQPSGPQNVLRVLYEDGNAKEFFKLLKSIEGEASNAARDFYELVSDKLSDLARLDNHDKRYFEGSLYTKAGGFPKIPSQVKLTASGKMQLLLHGTGPLETALRNVVAKPWIEKLVLMERQEKSWRMEFNDSLAETRFLSTATGNSMKETMILNGMTESSAKSTIRGSQPKLNKAILPGFKSATNALLCAEGKASKMFTRVRMRVPACLELIVLNLTHFLSSHPPPYSPPPPHPPPSPPPPPTPPPPFMFL